jgi:hypothetical protein
MRYPSDEELHREAVARGEARRARLDFKHRDTSYEITVSYLDAGEIMVQVAGVPYPIGMFKETGWDLDRLLAGARQAIVDHRNQAVGS